MVRHNFFSFIFSILNDDLSNWDRPFSGDHIIHGGSAAPHTDACRHREWKDQVGSGTEWAAQDTQAEQTTQQTGAAHSPFVTSFPYIACGVAPLWWKLDMWSTWLCLGNCGIENKNCVIYAQNMGMSVSRMFAVRGEETSKKATSHNCHKVYKIFLLNRTVRVINECESVVSCYFLLIIYLWINLTNSLIRLRQKNSLWCYFHSLAGVQCTWSSGW